MFTCSGQGKKDVVASSAIKRHQLNWLGDIQAKIMCACDGELN